MFPRLVVVLGVAVTAATARANPSDAEVVGTWEVTEFVFEGKALSPNRLAQGRATITADRITVA